MREAVVLPRVLPDPGERSGWFLLASVGAVSTVWAIVVGVVGYRGWVLWRTRRWSRA